MQNEWDFWTIRIRINSKEENINGAECERKQGNDEGLSSLQLEMQSCHNDVRAMTPCFYVSNERASLGLSRAICTKSLASVILETGRAKERPQQ